MRTITCAEPHVHLIEETDYPFRGAVRITVNPASPLSFPLHSAHPRVGQPARRLRINGNSDPIASSTPLFHILSALGRPAIAWKLTFPMKPRISRWFNDSVAVERGPLVFSYAIGESWVKLRDRGMTADWQVFPTSRGITLWISTKRIRRGPSR